MKALYERTKRMPDALRNKPTLPWYLMDYFIAFLELNRRRQYSMAEQTLLLTEIEAYSRIFGYDDDREFFFFVIGEMESEYMKWISEKRKQENEHNKSKRNRK